MVEECVLVIWDTRNNTEPMLGYKDDILTKLNFLFWGPFNSILGIVGNILCLPVMRKLAKENSAFLIQTAVVLDDLLSSLSFAVYFVFFRLFGVVSNMGPPWIMKSYFWVYIGMQSVFILNIMITASIFFCLSQAMLRAYALKAPIKFAKLNHRKVVAGIAALSYTVGLLTSFQMSWYREVKHCPEMDMFYVDKSDFYRGWGWPILLWIQLSIRLGGFVLLFVMVIVDSKLYKKHKAQHDALSSTRSGGQQSQSIDAKLLQTLLGIQFATLFIGFLPLWGFFFGEAFLSEAWPGFASFCLDLVDYALGAGMTWNFLFYIALSKKFRKMLKSVWLFESSVGSVAANGTKRIQVNRAEGIGAAGSGAVAGTSGIMPPTAGPTDDIEHA